jgi:DNA-binding transcriptional regulator YiaG
MNSFSQQNVPKVDTSLTEWIYEALEGVDRSEIEKIVTAFSDAHLLTLKDVRDTPPSAFTHAELKDMGILKLGYRTKLITKHLELVSASSLIASTSFAEQYITDVHKMNDKLMEYEIMKSKLSELENNTNVNGNARRSKEYSSNDIKNIREQLNALSQKVAVALHSRSASDGGGNGNSSLIQKQKKALKSTDANRYDEQNANTDEVLMSEIRNLNGAMQAVVADMMELRALVDGS